MKLYAIVDGDLNVARHRSKNTLAVFTDLKMLKKHAWRYGKGYNKHKVAELEIKQLYELEGAE